MTVIASWANTVVIGINAVAAMRIAVMVERMGLVLNMGVCMFVFGLIRQRDPPAENHKQSACQPIKHARFSRRSGFAGLRAGLEKFPGNGEDGNDDDAENDNFHVFLDERERSEEVSGPEEEADNRNQVPFRVEKEIDEVRHR